ncbi:hypothetical protein SODALDRAFT_319873 [Sodiomyces alkalinus F11]|uniref:SART-1 protein n=1 Tax=Sodiomyces alkalinus (strain CBS 110278 / VKM F-3762 / F11) TaxID=1314773 RepID=A0A3N2Q9G7_SODAK|nr:hypothetical protein SODALDRAFT_319873 [Sodiomyces alkalinus F11]ROT43404.1 hypothetical protein SODALDRAFT_319873 [Sodiomyces alkalinus F11]
MDAATIEETNRMRESLGLKPLPIPGAAAPSPSRESPEPSEGEAEDEPSTIETREAKAYDNYKALQEAEEAKRRREARAAAVKRQRDEAQRFASLHGKGLGEAHETVDVDAKTWLKLQKKRRKAIEKTRKLEDEQAAADAAAAAALEYTSKDLAGVKVAHDVADFLKGDEQVLTLKDTTIDENEAEGDELENLDLRAKENLKERLDVKKKTSAYNGHDDESGERGVLSQYDEEIYGKKGKKFTLDSSGAIAELADILDGPAEKSRKLQSIDLDMMQDKPQSDYLDVSEIKVKKPKKKKSKTTRQKPIDDDDIITPDATIQDNSAETEMDVDSAVPAAKKRKTWDDSFVDDEDLQTSLAIQRRTALKKRKRTRPEDIAREVRQLSEKPEDDAEEEGGVVIDDVSEFVSGLKKPEENESRVRKSKPAVEQSATAMDEELDEDEDVPMDDAARETSPEVKKDETPGPGVGGFDEEKTVGTNTGVGSALALLRERGLIQESHGAELNEEFRQKAEFLASKRRLEQEADDKTRHQRERDRMSGRWDRMSVRDREDWARQQNAYRDQQQSRTVDGLFKAHYKPNVELKYTDEFGRRLDQKEAFKHLSHQFHGKGSGKGKTDKRLKKIESEKKRESESILDSSANATMSASGAKRREAGVRLQ